MLLLPGLTAAALGRWLSGGDAQRGPQKTNSALCRRHPTSRGSASYEGTSGRLQRCTQVTVCSGSLDILRPVNHPVKALSMTQQDGASATMQPAVGQRFPSLACTSHAMAERNQNDMSGWSPDDAGHANFNMQMYLSFWPTHCRSMLRHSSRDAAFQLLSN
jgi:hypothetical protein